MNWKSRTFTGIAYFALKKKMDTACFSHTMWFYESQNKMQPLFLIYIQWYAVKVLFGFLNVCANEFYHNLNPNLTPGDIVFDNTKTLFFSLYSRRRLHIWSVTTPHCSFQVQYLTCYHTRHIQKGNINTQHSKSWIIPLRCIFSYICCLSVIIHIFLHFSFHLLMWELMVFFFHWLFPSFFLFIRLSLYAWSSEDLRMEREKLLRALLMTELWDNTHNTSA